MALWESDAITLAGMLRGREVSVFVGGGNSFRLLRTLTTLGVLEALRQAALAGLPYLLYPTIGDRTRSSLLPVAVESGGLCSITR